MHGELKTEEVDGRTILWKIKDANEKEFEFPATGLRDMGIRERKVEAGTWPAHSKLTFIATSGFVCSRNNDTKIETSSCLLFSIDYRNKTKKNILSAIFIPQTTLTALHCVLSATISMVPVHGKA